MPGAKKANSAPICDQTTAQQLVRLILDYWTPERLAIWKEYEKTDRSVPWREFERDHKEVQSC